MKYIAHDIRIFIRSLAGGLDSPTAHTLPTYPNSKISNVINDLRADLHPIYHVHNPVDNLCITGGYNPHYIACYPMRLYATILHLADDCRSLSSVNSP